MGLILAQAGTCRRHCLFPFTATSRVCTVFTPQLQHLSRCFAVIQPPHVVRPRKPHTRVHSRIYTRCRRIAGSVCIAAAVLGLCTSPASLTDCRDL